MHFCVNKSGFAEKVILSQCTYHFKGKKTSPYLIDSDETDLLPIYKYQF